MGNKKIFPLAILAIGAGIGLAWAIRRAVQEVPGLSTWQRVLAEKHGPAKAEQLAGQIRLRYEVLRTERSLPRNPVLRRHTLQHILPGLALYQVLLREYQDDRQAALAELDEAFRALSLKKNRLLLAPLKLLPDSFGLFKLAFKVQMQDFPAEGWYTEYVDESDDRIAFNMRRCHYLKTLTDYGAPELTASFCKTDDVMAELFPPCIRFVRPHTLGRGDELCDFQYFHIKPL